MRDFAGLTASEVQDRIDRGLANSTRVSTSRTIGEILRAHVLTRFNAILGVLLIAVFIADSPGDGLFGFVLLANSTIGVVQEWSAKRKLDALAVIYASHATVVRDGKESTIPLQEIVLDDLVVVKAGDQIPADGTVLRSNQLDIDESNLTGESDSVLKTAGDTVMSGTIVTAGVGMFVATSVGEDAYAHRLAAEARVFTRAQSEIQLNLGRVLAWVTWILLAVTPLIIWSHFRRTSDDGWQVHIVRITAGLVGLVPEGLVLLTTLAFLSAALSLSRQNVLVQELPAVEILARVDVVCIDKTGTLTSGNIKCDDIEILTENEHAYLALAALANDPSANNTLLAIQEKYSETPQWITTGHIPFDSSRKWKAQSFEHHGSWFLGAPEMLWASNDETAARVTQLAESGKRVMLLCHSNNELPKDHVPTDIVPVALLTLIEEIRDDAEDTLLFFKKQQVRVIVISGDNPKTVGSIAHSVGVDGIPIDARTLGESPLEISASLSQFSIYGRVTPQQKRLMVEALQNQGHVVAMTGDGVNDALALKRADIGIAMENSAPATKAVAQIVLLDGKFSHLPSVLSEGRRVIGNVERVAHLFLAKNAMSLLAILLSAGAGLTFPILPRQMTLLSTVSIGVPAFFLALGSNTARYKTGFLRRIMWFSLPAGALSGASVVIADVWTHDHTGTAATTTALITFLVILAAKSQPLRGWRLILLALMTTVAVSTFAITPLQEFFNFSITTEIIWKSVVVSVPLVAYVVSRMRKNAQEVLRVELVN